MANQPPYSNTFNPSSPPIPPSYQTPQPPHQSQTQTHFQQPAHYPPQLISSPPFSTETPPPPPPKPSSHETSRRNTPSGSGPPLPPPPPGSQSRPISGAYESWTSPPRQTSTNDTQLPNPQPQIIPPPEFPESWLPAGITEKSTADLLHILQTPPLLRALASTHPSYTTSQAPLKTQLQTNMSLANTVKNSETHLSTLRAQTLSLLASTQSLTVQWRQKQAEMDRALEPWSPKSLYVRFVAGLGEQEGLVAGVEESFLALSDLGEASEREVAEWVRRVREEGGRAWMRREGRWRWDEGRVGGWR